jgi:hypothetical protein
LLKARSLTSKPDAFKKINPPELPTIDINSGGNISHIKNAIVAHCQKELGTILMIFTEGRNQDKIVVTYDPTSLSKENDPLSINKARVISQVKQANIDNLAYDKSKPKLHGILTSMTTKEAGLPPLPSKLRHNHHHIPWNSYCHQEHATNSHGVC